jgi:hypothetical protein
VTQDEKAGIRRWVETWQEYGPELERIRLRVAREEDKQVSIQQLAGAFNYATRTHPARATSGLVEMQRQYLKLRNDSH